MATIVACREQKRPQEKHTRVLWKPIASWSGHGNIQTDSFEMEAGNWRVKWETHNAKDPQAGVFRVDVHSAISGRPLETAVEHRGDGRDIAYIDGSVERLIMLNVNGQQRAVDVMKQETLAMTLRYKLGLTGTKLGCDRAECGSCTVLIDDVPHLRVLRAHPYHPREERSRRSKGWPPPMEPSSGAAGSGGRAGFPVRFLHARFCDVHRWIPQEESESDAGAARARYFGQPLPVPGLRQDSHCADARRRTLAGSEKCLARQTTPKQPLQIQTGRW
jgi:hypothetical protein